MFQSITACNKKISEKPKEKLKDPSPLDVLPALS
jgi:hypothetical protein